MCLELGLEPVAHHGGRDAIGVVLDGRLVDGGEASGGRGRRAPRRRPGE